MSYTKKLKSVEVVYIITEFVSSLFIIFFVLLFKLKLNYTVHIDYYCIKYSFELSNINIYFFTMEKSIKNVHGSD